MLSESKKWSCEMNLPHFNGADYVPERDDARLRPQHERVKAAMQDGGWHTLRALAEATHAPEASVSAQLRHLRKPRFGGHRIERRHVGNGLYEYRLATAELMQDLCVVTNGLLTTGGEDET